MIWIIVLFFLVVAGAVYLSVNVRPRYGLRNLL